jgi:hypothetical protein
LECEGMRCHFDLWPGVTNRYRAKELMPLQYLYRRGAL